ncbi:hypothetical protein NXW64_06995 [Bacteroides ovatus]|nr:hypothetical protein NXW64_06995 [Bacteroides ovatus]
MTFFYAVAEPVWMESVSVASKGVGDSCCKILSENTLARRERGRFCGKPPRDSILQQREPRNYLLLLTTDFHTALRGMKKREEKVMGEKRGENDMP